MTVYKTRIYDCPCVEEHQWAIVVNIKRAAEFGWDKPCALEMENTPEGVIIRKVDDRI